MSGLDFDGTPETLLLTSNRLDGLAGGAEGTAVAAFRLRVGAMADEALPAAASSLLMAVMPNAHSSYAVQVTPFDMDDPSGSGGIRLLVSTSTDASGGRQVYDLWRFVGMGTPALSTILSTTVANIDSLTVNNLTVTGATTGVGGGVVGDFSGNAVPHWSTSHLSAGVAYITALSCVNVSSTTVQADTVYARVLQTSDERLKTDVEAVQNGLSILRELKPVYFNWRDGRATTRPGWKDLGFLAQQVEGVLPHVVAREADEDGLRRMNYAQLTALLAAGVQEQADAVAALQARMASVEARLQTVELGAAVAVA